VLASGRGGTVRAAAYNYGQAIGMEPNRALFHKGHGDLLIENGQPEQAVTAYIRAFELDRQDHTRVRRMAERLVEHRMLEPAARLYESELRHRPDDAELRNRIAVLWRDGAEQVMSRHPRGRLLITSPAAATTVRRCAEQGLAAEPTDTTLAAKLTRHQSDADKAMRKRWRWPGRGPAVRVIALGLMLAVLGVLLRLVGDALMEHAALVGGLATAVGGVLAVAVTVVAGIKPGWWHNLTRFK
jgi:tetratricopeptide (TPR) repeat protein